MHTDRLTLPNDLGAAARGEILTTAADMYDHLVALLPSDVSIRVERDYDAPMLWAVWCDDEITGAGDTREEALKDALLTAAGWAL